MKIQIPRGTVDIMPGESEKWQYIEQVAQQLFKRARYSEIRTPIFEHTELFQKGVGDTTDIVTKEMYTFKDRKDRSMTLRPEGTASVARAYVEHKLFGQVTQPAKLFYCGPMFRYERPQKGRQRQFVQLGAEAIGVQDPAIDAEIMALALSIYQELGLKEVKLVINSLGDKDSRLAHRESMIAHFKPTIHEFCADCQTRLEKNPLRILDCKVDHAHPLIASAPSIISFLNEESMTYYTQVKHHLDALDIAYVEDPTMVRGLDYYNHSTFEIMSEAKGFGAITTLCGGGRYNGLVEELGGPASPGVGFALSIERLLAALAAEEIVLPFDNTLDVFVVGVGEAVSPVTLKLTMAARQAGFTAERDYLSKKVKGQFKTADREKARFVVVVGEEELAAGLINIKDMTTGTQEKVAMTDFIATLQSKQAEGETN